MENRIQTLCRFKGQSAPYVIPTETDFEALDELTPRKFSSSEPFFVGAARTIMRLILALSERAARALPEGIPEERISAEWNFGKQ